MQDAFLSIWRASSTYRSELASVRDWLLGICAIAPSTRFAAMLGTPTAAPALTRSTSCWTRSRPKPPCSPATKRAWFARCSNASRRPSAHHHTGVLRRTHPHRDRPTHRARTGHHQRTHPPRPRQAAPAPGGQPHVHTSASTPLKRSRPATTPDTAGRVAARRRTSAPVTRTAESCRSRCQTSAAPRSRSRVESRSRSTERRC